MIVFWIVGIVLGLGLAWLESKAEQAQERKAREQAESWLPTIEREFGGKATLRKNPDGPGYIVDMIYD